MLNLLPIFDDAIFAFQEYSEFLTIAPLPATIFLMQSDVINHYDLALTHYFPISLSEHYLQHSSIGTPYEKWAKFTNEDFCDLSFTVHNLLRYTGRFVYETECAALAAIRQHDKRAERSNAYTDPLCDIELYDRKIGIRIEPDMVLVRTPFASGPKFEGKIISHNLDDGSSITEYITTDANGIEQKRVITQVEERELDQTLHEERIDITDRKVIQILKDEGLAEVQLLIERNNTFGDLCQAYYAQHPIAKPFKAYHQSWLM